VDSRARGRAGGPISLIPVPVVHAVTDDRVLALPDFFERAAALALGPAFAIHLRGRLPGRVCLDVAGRLVAIAAASGTAVLVHDRVDVALLAGASGAHLPAAGPPCERVRVLLGRERLLGRSVHSAAEARSAATDGSDYAILGNIWETPSHPGRPGLGPAALRGGAAVPAIAIGGVTVATAAQAAAAGAHGVAAIRALWDADDPAAAARAMRVLFRQ
jgi:thiamine-phosphate pyrophosphorylase